MTSVGIFVDLSATVPVDKFDLDWTAQLTCTEPTILIVRLRCLSLLCFADLRTDMTLLYFGPRSRSCSQITFSVIVYYKYWLIPAGTIQLLLYTGNIILLTFPIQLHDRLLLNRLSEGCMRSQNIFRKCHKSLWFIRRSACHSEFCSQIINQPQKSPRDFYPDAEKRYKWWIFGRKVCSCVTACIH